MTSLKRKLLWSCWWVAFALAVASLAIFVQGLIRDTRAGEPTLALDFAAVDDWQVAPFRIWTAGDYKLFISSVNHEPAWVGAPLDARFEIQIVDPDGRPFFHRIYPAGSTGHALPQNYGDSKLGSFALDGWSVRQWSLKARVLDGDPRFKTARSQVKLWRERQDPGMGGLINYVMIIPAGGFLALALVLAIPLARHGAILPLAASALSGIVFMVLFVA